MRRNSRNRKEIFLRRVGDFVRQRRVSLLITQEELAQRASMHRTYVTDIENGLRNPAVLTLVRVAAALELPLWRLVKSAESGDSLEGEPNK